jgi:hypothetical protein
VVAFCVLFSSWFTFLVNCKVRGVVSSFRCYQSFAKQINSPNSVEYEVSLAYSQDPATASIPSHKNPVLILPAELFKIRVCKLLSFFKVSLAKHLNSYVFFLKSTTCPTHIIILSLLMIMKFVRVQEVFKS